MVATPIRDMDNDGVMDDDDQCPTIAGTAALNGCPDSDGDGIADNKDDCPLVAGKAEFNGCPDSDGDGIPDQKDKCPYVAGQSQYDGCPPPDKDNDGFTDDVDKCPDQYSKTNNGCPEIRQEIIRQVEKAAKAIFFETAKATIKKASYKQLDAVVRVLKADPSLYADIEGHTDNVGNDEYNMDLSQKRAEAVRDYFVSKGISADRLTAQGFGETQPIATNETATGRASNRRTVIKLRNYQK
jgi:outer membrane protein OmpA-like peptidoglycan-associated protein